MTIIKGSGGGGLLFRNGGGTDLSGFGYKFRLFQDHVDLLYGNTSLCSSTALKAQLDQTYLLTAIARRHTINVYCRKMIFIWLLNNVLIYLFGCISQKCFKILLSHSSDPLSVSSGSSSSRSNIETSRASASRRSVSVLTAR